MVKLIFIDLDGTLLNRLKDISTFSVNVIRNIQKKGIRIILTTARPPRDSIVYYNKLDLNTPVINYNGGLIQCYKTGERYYCYTIEPVIFHQLYYEIGRYIENFLLEIDNEFYVYSIDEQVKDWIKSGNKKPRAVGNILNLIDMPISKILIKAKYEVIKQIERKFNGVLNKTISDRDNKWIEWLHPNATKSHAMIKVSEMYGVDLSKVMAIGDELNDKSMIQMAGIGVAMGNAHEEIKAIADYITDSNENDGAAKAILKFLK